MLDRAKLSRAKQAAERPLDITNSSELAQAAEAWKRVPVLGLDTEFIRERTYFAQLALIQVSDGQSVWLIDPLKFDDLTPFVEMLCNPSITKILHSPSEDLELLQHLFATTPQPMFDTQLAATATGQPLQMSYSRLVEQLLGEELDSSSTRSNWLRRPLTAAQRQYAALDVAFLPLLHELLNASLTKSGRLAWHNDDILRLANDAASAQDPDRLYLRIREASRMNQEQLNVLQRLAAWRDRKARTGDRPRKHVLSDKNMVEIARLLPANQSDLQSIGDLHSRFIERHCVVLVQIVTDGRSANSATPGPPEALGQGGRKKCAKLQELVLRRADQLGVEPTWLATRRDLESIIRSAGDISGNEKLTGWRKREIIDDLVSELEGIV